MLSFGPRSLADISRRIRVSLGVLTGWMGLPVPKPMPIYMVGHWVAAVATGIVVS